MFEDFKKNVKKYNDKPNRTLKPIKLTLEESTKIKQKTMDSCNVALKHLFPECLDSEGIDISLISGAEWNIMVAYAEMHKCFLEQYPQTKKETPTLGNTWIEPNDTNIQINTALAKENPKGKTFFEILCKVKSIYDKIMFLQSQANAYEKNCLRLYQYITYNRPNTSNTKILRDTLSDRDIFEIVETYFKICKKHKVPILEEPYYFLSNQKRCEIKLMGDMLRRTTAYDDFEICISILEETS